MKMIVFALLAAFAMVSCQQQQQQQQDNAPVVVLPTKK